MKWLLSSIHPQGCSGVSLSLSHFTSLNPTQNVSVRAIVWSCLEEKKTWAFKRRVGMDQQERTGAGQIVLPGEVHSTGQQVKNHLVGVFVDHVVFSYHALCAIFYISIHETPALSSPGNWANTSLCPRQISAAIGIWLCWRILSVRQLVHNLWQFFVRKDYHWKCYHIFTTTPLTLNRLSHIPSQPGLSHG